MLKTFTAQDFDGLYGFMRPIWNEVCGMVNRDYILQKKQVINTLTQFKRDCKIAVPFYTKR